MKNRVLRDYSSKPDGQLGDFGLHVGTSLTGNANFTTPPVTPAALTTQSSTFNTSVATASDGTAADTEDKNNKRAALIATLDQLANYVDLTANGDAAKILSSGFDLVGGSNAPVAPGVSAIVSVSNVATGKLGVELEIADNAWVYIVEYTALPGGAVKTASFTDPHNVVLTGLTPGTMYSIRVMVMGSKNQATEWSDPVQHMAT